jgi:hypothetical protein
MPSVCFLQPSPPPKGSSDEPQLGQINIKPAFTSPTNLGQCSEFLRKQVPGREGLPFMAGDWEH